MELTKSSKSLSTAEHVRLNQLKFPFIQVVHVDVAVSSFLTFVKLGDGRSIRIAMLAIVHNMVDFAKQTIKWNREKESPG